MRKRYRAILYLVLLVAVFLGLRFANEQAVLRKPIPSGTEISAQTTYTLCHHEVTEPVNMPVRQMSALSLEKSALAGVDWHPEYVGNKLILSRTAEGLCPADRKKSHLATKGEFITVVRGPAGIDGGVIKVTKIKVSSIPRDMQDEARAGKLNLPDGQSLLQILDSIEEDIK